MTSNMQNYNKKVLTHTGVKSDKLKKKKNYWLWKWAFGVDQHENLEEKGLEMK
jgi:hypothetical protein